MEDWRTGYDAWLDNHGNPGGSDMSHGEFGEGWWPLAEEIDVTQIAENEYRISRVHGSDTITLSIGQGPDGSQLFIDGEYRDLGDDFIPVLSILDDYHEQPGAGGIGITIRQQPFQDEE
jgi:hypothetical protein